MKKLGKLIGIAALVAVIGFTFAVLSLTGCDNGSTGGGGDPNSSTYTGYDADGKEYKLVISKSVNSNPGTGNRDSSPGGRANGRAAYDPQKGDKFVLTVKNANGTAVGTSTGTVDNISRDASGDTYTLDHEGGKFTAKLKGNALTEISGLITFDDDGGTLDAPQTLTPTKPTPGNPGSMTWTAVTASGLGFSDVIGIAYGSNRFVAVGGLMAYSDDGVNWITVTDIPLIDSFAVTGIAYGSNKFVAVGTRGNMVYSADGKTWTAVPDNTIWDYQESDGETIKGDITTIAYGGGRFIAGGLNGKMAYSDNGINWTPVADSIVWDFTISTVTLKSSITVIAYGGNRFVAGGYWGNKAYSSDNGITWTALADNTFDNDPFTAIAYGGGKFVAALDNKMAYSANGTSWTVVSNSPFGSKDSIFAIGYGGDRFIAGGSAGKMAHSTDGINWTDVTDSTVWQSIIPYTAGTGTATVGVGSVAYGGGKFVAGGGYGRIAYSGGSGGGGIPNPISGPANWMFVEDSPFGDYGDSVGAIAFGDGKFVTGVYGEMAYSADGANWTTVTNSLGIDISAIAYGGGTFVAGGGYGDIAYSTDGASWTAVSNSPFRSELRTITAIAYGGGTFVAVGGYGKMAYSTDGANWTPVADSTIWQYILYGHPETASISGIAYGNNKFVAVGVGGKMATSTDGVNWTPVAGSLFVGDEISSIAYGGGRFVAGYGYGESSLTAYSTDGENWTFVPINGFSIYSSIETVAYGNGRFVAGNSGGQFAYSANGESWTVATQFIFSGYGDILAIAYGNGRFVASARHDGRMAYADW